MSDDWLTVHAAALAYGVTEKTIRRRIQAGKLNHTRAPGPNGEYRVPPPQRAVLEVLPRQVDTDDPQMSSLATGGDMLIKMLDAYRQHQADHIALIKHLTDEVERLNNIRAQQAEELGRLRAQPKPRSRWRWWGKKDADDE